MASDLFSPLTFMSTSIIFFHLFFGLPFFEKSILKFIATDCGLSQSILSM